MPLRPELHSRGASGTRPTSPTRPRARSTTSRSRSSARTTRTLSGCCAATTRPTLRTSGCAKLQRAPYATDVIAFLRNNQDIPARYKDKSDELAEAEKQFPVLPPKFSEEPEIAATPVSATLDDTRTGRRLLHRVQSEAGVVQLHRCCCCRSLCGTNKGSRFPARPRRRGCATRRTRMNSCTIRRFTGFRECRC